MTKISEAEFARICEGIVEDRESIIKQNPVGTSEGILFWMLLGCLVSYLNLMDSDLTFTESESLCCDGPEAKSYRDAITFILKERRIDDFDANKYLDTLTNAN